MAVVIGSSVCVVEPMETDIDAECVNRAVSGTECQVCGYVSCYFLSVSIFADSLFKLGVKLVLQTLHGGHNRAVGENCFAGLHSSHLCLLLRLFQRHACCYKFLCERLCQVSSHLICQVVCQISDTWCLVYRLVF